LNFVEESVEAVIFIGIQGAGKSTFYRDHFFKSHIRLTLDMLRTRYRENILFQACLAAKQPFVVDNTNPTPADRARYILPAKAARFRVAGYYFESAVQDAVQRNAARSEKERVPNVAIYGTAKKLVLPTLAEGFDALYVVKTDSGGDFSVQSWPEN
jgi:predicted kinase